MYLTWSTRRGAPAILLALLLSILPATTPTGAQSGADSYTTTTPDDVVVPTVVADPAARLAAVGSLEPTTAAVLTTPASFPDALASGVLQRDAMLLPAGPDDISDAVLAVLLAAGVQRVTVLGGQAAISDQALDALPADIQVARIGGQDRTETAALIAMAAAPTADTVLLARGRGPADNPTAGFIDAIGAGALSAAFGWPVLLIDGSRPSAATQQAMATIDPARVLVLGGTAALTDQSVQALAGDRPWDRLAGPDRYATAAAVAAELAPDGAASVVVVDGTEATAWAAGFPAARLGAVRGAPVVLATRDDVPDSSAQAIAELAPRQIVCLASEAACQAARQAAGLPAPAVLDVDPAPGQILTDGQAVRITGPGQQQLVDDGGCLAGQLPDLRATQAVTAGCTISVRVEGAGLPGQVTTLTWPSLRADSTLAIGGIDWAASTLGDRWDYSDAVDGRTDGLIGNPSVPTNLDTAASVIRWDGMAFLPLLWAGFPGAVPVAPDGLLNPLDTSRFTHAHLRLWSDRATGWELIGRRCSPVPTRNCVASPEVEYRAGGALTAGWNEVVVDLSAAGWTGVIHTLYLTATGQIQLDDARLTPGPSGQVITVTGPPGQALVWDSDDDPTNNIDPTSAMWGPLTDGRLSADLLPPGHYWVHGAPGSVLGPLTLGTPPAPVITAPSVDTADDYATTVRGNPWDFAAGEPAVAGTDDLLAINAGDIQLLGQGLRASNVDADPYLELAIGAPIDTTRFTTAVIDFTVDGPLDLSAGPGGGTHGRLLWQQSNPVYANGQDIVAYANQRRFIIDMAGPFPSSEPGEPAWTAGPVTRIRFDPNEDPQAGRGWVVERIRLVGPQRVGTSVTLTARDGGVPGASRSAQWQIAPDPQGPYRPIGPATSSVGGEVSTAVSTCGLASGRWWIALAVTGPDGGAVTTSDTPLDVPGC